MEPIGVAIGVAGLAGLFSSCIDCFNIFQRGRYLGHDYLVLETKFTNQRLRLIAWGGACGFMGDRGADDVGWGEDVRDAVFDTLTRLHRLLQDGKILMGKYGLTPYESSADGAASGPALITETVSRLRISKIHHFRFLGRNASSTSSFRTAARWAIRDGDKFATLVQHFKDFVDDLEELTVGGNVAAQQRKLIQAEVESIYDVSELQTIEEARMEGLDPRADAASLRLCQISRAQEQPDEPSAFPISHSTHDRDDRRDRDWVDVQQRSLPDPLPKEMESQVLYRVHCDSQPTAIFFDRPSHSPEAGDGDQWLMVDGESIRTSPRSLHIASKRPLRDLQSYIDQNTQLMYIIFEDYICSHEADPTLENPQPPKPSIYLISKAICDALNSYALEAHPPEFRPRMELRYPYAWYYNNRGLLRDGCHSHNVLLCDYSFSETRWGGPDVGWGQAPMPKALKEMLKFIEESMAEAYERMSVSVRINHMIAWEQVPLFFSSGNILVEKRPEGDDDFRGCQQVAPPRLVQEKGTGGDEYFEIGVCRYTATSTRLQFHVQIPRSLFGMEGIAAISSLPVEPLFFARDCNEGYLSSRGDKFAHLDNWRYVRYSDSSDPDMDGEYILDEATFRALHARDPSSKITPRYQEHKGGFRGAPAMDDSMLEMMLDYVEWEQPDDFLEDDSFYFDGEDESRARARKYQSKLCMPHAMYGFDLVGHVWRRVPLRSVNLDLEPDCAIEEHLIGEEAKESLVQLLTPVKQEGFSSDKRPALPRMAFSFYGVGRGEAAKVASHFTKRPLYRIRLSKDVDAMTATFRLAKPLATKWGCIVAIEVPPELEPDDQHPVFDVVATFLRGFNGVAIISSRTPLLESEVREKVCMTLQFVHHDSDSACRRNLWRELINRRVEPVLPSDEEFGLHLDRLSAVNQTLPEIHSIVDAVLPPGVLTKRKDINWRFMEQLATGNFRDLGQEQTNPGTSAAPTVSTTAAPGPEADIPFTS